jgi:hypothetical protein
MEWLAALLPITVIVAIGLFVLKELLEWTRRSRADLRKIKAFKTLLMRECELNNWAHRRIADAISNIRSNITSQEIYQYSIKKRDSGKIFFEERHDEHSSSWPLPPVRIELMSKLMLDVAMLDDALFVALDGAYDASVELNHLRQGLIDFIDDNDEVHLEGFVDYALSELPDVHAGLESLYKACSGKELTREATRIR